MIDVDLDKSGCSVTGKVIRLRSQLRDESVRRSSSSTSNHELDLLFSVTDHVPTCKYNKQEINKVCRMLRFGPPSMVGTIDWRSVAHLDTRRTIALCLRPSSFIVRALSC